MKRVLSLVSIGMLIACLASAQPGSIGVYTDTQGMSCNLNNTGGYMQVFCVHVHSPGATGCQFMLQIVGTPLTYVGETSPFSMIIGNSQTGVAIAYGSCLSSPIHLLSVTYMGISQACDMIQVISDPSANPPGIYVTDCMAPHPNMLVATGYQGVINSNATCPCGDPFEGETSWGKVKAIFQ